MRKYTLLTLLLTVVTVLNAQNTIPTTTCTGAMKINDSLNVNKDITALGDITSKGEIVATDTMRAMENVIASKDIKVEGSVFVNSDVMVEGKVNTKGGLTFDGVSGLFYTAPSATQGARFELGPKTTNTLPFFQCSTPTSQPWNSFYYAGDFVSYLPAGSTTQFPLVNSAFRIGIAPWNGNALMDVSGVDANGQGYNGLEINSFCKRNTYINTGWNIPQGVDGGTVFLGAKVDMQSSLKIGWSASGAIDLLTSIDINQNQNNANGVRVNTWNNGVKAFSVFNNGNNMNKNTFVVYGDGRTQIGPEKPLSPHTDAMLSVDGKIASKSLYVLKPATWADYVFINMKQESLQEVEKYIIKHKHLPGIPSEAEILENGYDINEINAKLLEKVEKLYLHIIELEKEIKKIKGSIYEK